MCWGCFNRSVSRRQRSSFSVSDVFLRVRCWDMKKSKQEVVDVPSIVDGEYAENEFRKDFTVSERVAIAKELEDGIGERRGGRTEIKCSGVKPQIIADAMTTFQEKKLVKSLLVAAFGNHETYRQAKIGR